MTSLAKVREPQTVRSWASAYLSALI